MLYWISLVQATSANPLEAFPLPWSISILPMPGRVFEKIINERMKAHFENTGYLSEQQNGFRSGRSTDKSLATLLDALLAYGDEGDVAVTVFLDFKKAFDTVNHDILMWKLAKAG